MKPKNIYLSGVGGQGIGLLSDVLTKACLTAGYNVRGCDTHGLAQRHGTVVSHLRIGDNLFTPQVLNGQTDLIVSLERLEALRAATTMLKKSGTVVYYDTVYQPIHVRMGKAEYPTIKELESVVETRKAQLVRVYIEDLNNPRMQNVALLGCLASVGAIEGVTKNTIEQALCETVPPKVLEANLAVFGNAVDCFE